MSCPTYRKLCKRLIISQNVTFAGGNLVINLPTGSYQNQEKYCIVVAQNIPSTTTINAPVVFTIGTNTTTYPLLSPCCAPVTACSINTRTRYSVKVRTSSTTGVFQLFEKLPCSQCPNNLTALPATTTTVSVAGNDETNASGTKKS